MFKREKNWVAVVSGCISVLAVVAGMYITFFGPGTVDLDAVYPAMEIERLVEQGAHAKDIKISKIVIKKWKVRYNGKTHIYYTSPAGHGLWVPVDALRDQSALFAGMLESDGHANSTENTR